MTKDLAQPTIPFRVSQQSEEAQPVCPVCSSRSTPYARFDFSKSCNDAFEKTPQFTYENIPVDYHQCQGCGFLFTPFFDNWQPEDYANRIYNKDYLKADPPADGSRTRKLADSLIELLPLNMSLLDYGCGDGGVVERLQSKGYDVDGYDPYFGDWAQKPERTFDVILCVEVLEHITDPRTLAHELMRFTSSKGIIILTTLLSEYAISSNCWYLSPRNGHVGAHTEASLKCLFPTMTHLTPATHIIGDNNNALDFDRIGELVTAAVGTGPIAGK